jgi:2-desacetyl-2-hydroxyethyl bacteriochlorophyllide A dehydrogenase
MRAAILRQWGDASQLSIVEVPIPVPGPGEVRVNIHYAALNPVDYKMRNGRFRWFMHRRFPKILGVEAAGTVVECGPDVTALRPGDRVYIYTAAGFRLGCYAEFNVVKATEAVVLPPDFDLKTGASLSVAPVTALQVLRDVANVRTGTRVLINGASGAVGICAVQWAKHRGAHVTAVCSGRNAETVRQFGADAVIDYQQRDFTRENARFDLIFDCVSTLSFRACRRVLTPRGRYINLMLRPWDLVYQRWQNLFSQQKYHTVLMKFRPDDIRTTIEAVQNGQLRIPLDTVFAPEDIQQAHLYQESGRSTGKNLLDFQAVS